MTPPASIFILRGAHRAEREMLRLHLVAVASEVAVLTALMDEGLAGYGDWPKAVDLRQACWERRSAALGLLAPEFPLQVFSLQRLGQFLAAAEQALGEVRSAREALERLDWKEVAIST